MRASIALLAQNVQRRFHPRNGRDPLSQESAFSPVRIALLGADDVTLAVAAAAVRIGRDQIVQAAAVEGRAAELAKLIPGLRIDDDWERLLDSNAIDAVIVAADQPAARVEQLRRLIQIGMPTLVSHPISLSMLECYELEMIRRETGCAVVPYLPARWHPGAAGLPMLLAKTEESGIEQVVFHRFISRRDRESVLRQFAVDADLLQFIAGDATKLQALGSTATRKSILESRGPIDVRRRFALPVADRFRPRTGRRIDAQWPSGKSDLVDA